MGFPWQHSGKECTCRCRKHGFDPWMGKAPHALGHLILCATGTEPEL